MRHLLLIVLLFLRVTAAHAAGADELLEPDKAFRFSARALDAATVEVHYAIADGYYLYRERFRFAAEPPSVTLGQPRFPKGQIHEDKFFGRQETYRKEVRIRLPVEAAGAERLKLQVTSQGCADLGVCYVPQVQSADLHLASLRGPRSSIFEENEPFATSAERVTAASDDVRFAGVLESGRLWLVVAVFFGAGLLLSKFGFDVLHLASSWQARLAAASNRLGGGHWGAVVLMGALSAAIVSPCVAAPLAGALLYIGQARDVVLGGTALFSMAIGMGVPLVLVGVSEGMLLPRSGQWMHAVRQFFGVLLLAVAIWIVAPVIPVAVQMLLWAALLVGSGVYLGALEPLPNGASGWRRLWKALGVLALLAGVAQGIGALSGARDPARPLAGIFAESPESQKPLPFETVKGPADLDARLKTADKVAMLDFYADWCVSCKEMERFTFSDPQVRARLDRMVLLRADVTANTGDDKALLRRYRLFGPPGIVFFDASGREIEGLRVIGYQSPEKFIKSLDLAARY